MRVVCNRAGAARDDPVVKTRTGHLVLAAAAVLALAGCSSGPDPWEGTQLDELAWYACDDLSYQIAQAGGPEVTAALSPSQREPFLSGSTVSSAGLSGSPGMAEAAAAVAASGDGPAVMWADALGGLAVTCTDLGYVPE